MVLVTMNLDEGRAVQTPDDLRVLMTGFMEGRLDINRYERHA
jgi:hypothetical protein